MKPSRFLLLSILFVAITSLFVQCVKKNGDTTIPVAILYISPTTGTLTTVFTFDGSASHDGNNSTAGLMYRWDANSDGSWDIDWTTESIIEVTFNAPGSFEVIMEVKNAEDNSATDSKHVTVTGGGGLSTVTTTNATNITQTTATSGGNVTDQGSSSVTARGVCWSTTTNPTLANSFTTDGSGEGSFTSNLTGLLASTTYYVRAYATNSEGSAYGNQQSFTTSGGGSSGVPCPGMPTISYQGQTYNTVLIGSQCWLKENLNYQTGNSWCYDNDPANCATYGRLYDWETALGACPSGWHLPSDNEWCTLTQFIDPTVNCNSTEWSGTDVGLKMKSTSGWYDNGNGSNSSGFTALPGGYRHTNGSFRNLTYDALFWSSTEYSSASAWYRVLTYNNDAVHRHDYDRTGGFSARCLKD